MVHIVLNHVHNGAVLHYVHNGAPANVGETMLSRAATLYQLFARRITMTKGNLLGNYMAITNKLTPFQELRFLTLFWT